jgi:hypothetical protein
MVLGQLLAQRQYKEHRRKQRAEIEERRRARGADDGDTAEDLAATSSELLISNPSIVERTSSFPECAFTIFKKCPQITM